MKHLKYLFGRSAVLIAIAFALGGCLSKPAMNKQTFAFNTPAATNGVSGTHVLGIKSLQIDPPFDGRPLVYRTGEFTYERNPYAEFLGSPAQLLLAPVSGMMLGHDCFNAVVEPVGAIKPDTLVDISITELYGDIRNPDKPGAVLAMRMVFMEATNGLPGRVILQRNDSRWIPIKSTAPSALMDGWDKAFTQILTDVVSDFRQKESGLSHK